MFSLPGLYKIGRAMRDLVFKNITSNQKKRKILCTYEATEQGGVATRIKRSFVYIVKNAQDDKSPAPLPHLYLLKIKDTRTREEKFLCRIKGSLYTASDNRMFRVIFSHSLSINLAPTNPKVQA